ncbi:unnamed protein product [Mytilus coruscus]|uniref:Uncharacterized protein n=1 Tax=Mytilus coruscus TaxID=42192 RepID=A0A6J8DKZ5_MYTCO|nr:unnamed protein product [Mytilus coruscus]
MQTKLPELEHSPIEDIEVRDRDQERKEKGKTYADEKPNAIKSCVEERNGTYSKTIIKNKIIKSSVKQTWEDVIDYVIGTTKISDEVDTAIEKGHLTLKLHSNTGTETFEANPDDFVGTAYEFDKNLKYVKFIVDVTEYSTSSSCVQESDRSSIAGPSAFDRLMNRSTKQPQKKNPESLRFTAKDKLFNNICDEMDKVKAGFPSAMTDDVVSKHVMTITNVLWYLDGNKQKIMDRSRTTDVHPIPDRYAEFLDHSTDVQQKRQMLEHPVRQVDEFSYLEHRTEAKTVLEQYHLLDNIVSQQDSYNYILFEEGRHTNGNIMTPKEKYEFVKGLKLSVPIDILRYDPGGAVGGTIVVWRTPNERGQEEVMNASLKVFQKVKPLLPEYHTRQMRRSFVRSYCNLPTGDKISPAVLRFIYTDLTLDATENQNKGIEDRIRQAILSEDANLVTDLRHLNSGRPNDTFSIFFDKLSEKIEELTAADDRRQNVEHLSKYISVKNLIKDVKDELPVNTPHPKLKAQENSSFLCIDDKAKVDFGEPGMAIATGVRGKKSIVPVTSTLAALDHDMQSKGSLTPSVTLEVDIPVDDSSFYRGEVHVTYKDSVFQASSPWRHATEMSKMLQEKENVPTCLLLYSDGGPDHRLTFHAVKLSLIVLFKKLDLDFLVAGRTAPGHSWLNPAERIMSIVNIALQNVACREESRSEIEQILRSTNSMSDIRNKATKNIAIKTAWMESVNPLITLLEERTGRLTLKDSPFSVHKAATDDEVKDFEGYVRQVVCPEIKIGQYQEKHLKSVQGYQKFLREHYRERSYLFQIKKCNDLNCCTRQRGDIEFQWVPDPILAVGNEHYVPMASLLGKDTTDKDQPSCQKTRPAAVAEEIQGVRNAGLVGQNVRSTVKCYECTKPRCIYSKKKLTTRELRGMSRILEKYDYSCGADIIPEGDILQGVICVRMQLDCRSHIEFPYYADTNTVNVNKNICCHCGEAGEKDRDLLKKFKVVLPICRGCQDLGKEAMKRSPIK